MISGPSGAGKSTVVFKALEGRSDVCFSVSVTTRKRRPGEVDGKEYIFVDLDKYREMVAYGTPGAYVEQKLNEGMNVLLDIEVQGALQVHQKMPEAVMVFIVPPSMKELETRLRGRGTDSERKIEARLIRAKEEYASADFYDYIVINDDADKAAAEFSAIITAEYCKYDLRKNYLSEVD